MRTRYYTTLVRTACGRRFEMTERAKTAAQAVKQASKAVKSEGYAVKYAVWLGVASQAEWLERGGN